MAMYQTYYVSAAKIIAWLCKLYTYFHCLDEEFWMFWETERRVLSFLLCSMSISQSPPKRIIINKRRQCCSELCKNEVIFMVTIVMPLSFSFMSFIKSLCDRDLLWWAGLQKHQLKVSCGIISSHWVRELTLTFSSRAVIYDSQH